MSKTVEKTIENQPKADQPRVGVEKTKTVRKLVGLVISDKMNKTVVIKITEKRAHPMYGKIFTVSRKLQAHDEKDEYKIGDMVEISETRPFSKNKSWIVIRKVK